MPYRVGCYVLHWRGFCVLRDAFCHLCCHKNKFFVALRRHDQLSMAAPIAIRLRRTAPYAYRNHRYVRYASSLTVINDHHDETGRFTQIPELSTASVGKMVCSHVLLVKSRGGDRTQALLQHLLPSVLKRSIPRYGKRYYSRSLWLVGRACRPHD